MERSILDRLEPRIVWTIFEDITKVPRPSKKEGKICQWMENRAEENGISFNEDDVGNILLRKEATPGYEDYPTLVLQAHMDMVCEKTVDTEIDFECDPLKLAVENGYVTAQGTSLGADNGIGMAYGLAALTAEHIDHGPLEVVLTVDEETGLTGAFKMEKEFFSGKYLLNLDSESLGAITIGSAGGGDTHYSLPVTREKKNGWQAIKISIQGLKGGHSGVEIHLPRLNAIKTLLEGVLSLKRRGNVRLHSIEGGSVHNAIPREATFTVLVPENEKSMAMRTLRQWKISTVQEAHHHEPNIQIDIAESNETNMLLESHSDDLCMFLNEIPYGVLAFSDEIEGLVQTSNNLAIVETGEDTIEVHVSSRSSVDKELEKLRAQLRQLGETYGATVKQEEAYPGWHPDPDAPFVQTVKQIYENVMKKEVALKAVHGGLECGLFSRFDPALQIVSIGPEIKDAHTPEERVSIESVAILWKVITRIIENMGMLER